MNDELQPKDGDVPDPSKAGEIPQVKFTIREWTLGITIVFAGAFLSLAILGYSPNILVTIIAFVIMFSPIFWVGRKIYLKAKPIVDEHNRNRGYAIDTTRDRFYFNVATVKMVFPVLLAVMASNIYRASGPEARLDALVHSLVFSAFMILFSGFVGHFTHSWYARRQAQKKAARTEPICLCKSHSHPGLEFSTSQSSSSGVRFVVASPTLPQTAQLVP